MPEREITIRPAQPGDAAEIAAMLNELDVHEGNPGAVFTAEKVLADGFGPDAAFHVLVAEMAGGLVGYLLWHPAYDTDLAARKMWVSDIYLREAARGLGGGAKLLAAAARDAARRGCRSLELPVRHDNEPALAFYEARRGKRKGSVLYRWYDAGLEGLVTG